MPTVPVMDAKGQAKPGLELSADVFGAAPRVPLMHQAVVRELADRRAGTHSTRGRSQVSGGGRKPWRQKGTGRARQGSTRATQWKGGGKPFGPTPRSYDKAMPREMRREALRAAVAAKLAAGELKVVESVSVHGGKTKSLLVTLAGFGLPQAPTLVVVQTLGDDVARAARNVPWITVETPSHVSVYQLLRAANVVFERAGLLALEEALAQ
jgi:large subunit ribosomal protein L4